MTPLQYEVWLGTEAEIEKGWLVRDANPDIHNLVIARRFGLQQKQKVRLIDDFKRCGLNGACGLVERYGLYAIDSLSASLVHVLQQTPVASLPALHSTYKQYAVHPDDPRISRIMTKNPNTGKAEVFSFSALPFGATGSVAGFLRISTAVAFIGQRGLRLWWSSFFDDFPIISSSALSPSCKGHVHLLFNLLGIQFAGVGHDKEGLFTEKFKGVGLIVDLSDIQRGEVRICHTEDRRLELHKSIEDIHRADSLSAKAAESLRGRLHWYETFLFGRIANLALHVIGKRATLRGGALALDAELRRALELVKTGC